MPDVPDLRTTLGAAPLRRDVVRVHGPDAVTYLQGQLSQDVAALPIGESAPSLLLQPTGKVDAWLRVTRDATDVLLLDVDAGFGEPVLARLRRFRLRTAVELDLETWGGFALRGPGSDHLDAPQGAWRLPAGWPGVEGVDLLSPGEVALAGAPLVEPKALEALRIERGVPAMGAELTERTIPAEAGQWLVDASVSFTKGCYTGQELVARIDSRGGNVPHPIRGLLIDGADVGTGIPVEHDGVEVGTVTSAARSAALGPIGLAVVARTVPIGAAVVLATPDGPVPATVAGLPLR